MNCTKMVCKIYYQLFLLHTLQYSFIVSRTKITFEVAQNFSYISSPEKFVMLSMTLKIIRIHKDACPFHGGSGKKYTANEDLPIFLAIFV